MLAGGWEGYVPAVAGHKKQTGKEWEEGEGLVRGESPPPSLRTQALVSMMDEMAMLVVVEMGLWMVMLRMVEVKMLVVVGKIVVWEV